MRTSCALNIRSILKLYILDKEAILKEISGNQYQYYKNKLQNTIEVKNLKGWYAIHDSTAAFKSKYIFFDYVNLYGPGRFGNLRLSDKGDIDYLKIKHPELF